MSDAEDVFARVCADAGLPEPVREYRFHPVRKWRLDFMWPAAQLAVEIDGRGRHQTFIGYRNDCEKMNCALLLGIRVFRYPAADVKPSKSRKTWPRGAADMVEEIKRALQGS